MAAAASLPFIAEKRAPTSQLVSARPPAIVEKAAVRTLSSDPIQQRLIFWNAKYKKVPQGVSTNTIIKAIEVSRIAFSETGKFTSNELNRSMRTLRAYLRNYPAEKPKLENRATYFENEADKLDAKTTAEKAKKPLPVKRIKRLEEQRAAKQAEADRTERMISILDGFWPYFSSLHPAERESFLGFLKTIKE